MVRFLFNSWSRVATLLTALVVSVESTHPALPARRIAFGSCHSQLRQGIWDLVGASHPDQLLLLGDNIYADRRKGLNWHGATPEQLRRHYCALNGDKSWQRLVRQLGGFDSILATWDDHDYGINNGDSRYIFKNESRSAFLDFFRVPADTPRRSLDGVYMSSTFRLNSTDREFSYKVVNLDTRYNMVSATVSPERADMLGAAQWSWLEEQLSDAEVDLIFLGSSMQLLPTGKLIPESWHSHDPKGRERILRLISLSPCPNIIILSGDIHEAEISQACADCLYCLQALF